jgi:hypothetical protein
MMGAALLVSAVRGHVVERIIDVNCIKAEVGPELLTLI